MDLRFFKSYGRIGIIFFSGLAVFFLSAVLVLTVMTGGNKKVPVPSLIDKFYIDVHDDLVTTKELKVNIDFIELPDRPRGIIVHQSIRPGKFVEKKKTSITLTVNQGVTQLVVPELIEQTLEYAKSTLKNIPVGKHYFRLKLGTITYLDDGQPKNIILQQWPPANQTVNLDQKVSLLVTGSPAAPKKAADAAKDKKKTKNNVLNLGGMNVQFATYYLNKKYPGIKISTRPHRTPESVTNENPIVVRNQVLSGQVRKSKITAGTETEPKAVELTVFYFPNEYRYNWGVEMLEYEVPSNGKYTFIAQSRSPVKNTIMEGDFNADQKLFLFANRDRSLSIQVLKDGETQDKYKYLPEELD